MLSTVRTGVAGLGSRGFGLVKDLLMDLQGVEIVAVCDDFGDRAEKAQAAIREKTGKTPKAYRSYDEMLDAGDLDAVLVITPWETHVPFAIRAMEKGIPVGIEVGGATSVQECWDLVRTYEKTRTPFMFLENCCFGRTEMMVTHMVRQGLFGEIVHCAGAYAHDLRDEVAGGDENHHYRLRHYRNRNCENYPTHELGPIAKLLNVNSGNRMLSLTSMASKAAGMNAFGVEGKFNQGDVVTTLIRCAGGETIQLSLDTTLPRYYCRDFTVRGTKGLYEERTNSVYLTAWAIISTGTRAIGTTRIPTGKPMSIPCGRSSFPTALPAATAAWTGWYMARSSAACRRAGPCPWTCTTRRHGWPLHP